MKILHYVSLFSKTSETFVYDLILNMESRGIDNHVLTHIRINEKERPFDKCSVVPAGNFIMRRGRRLLQGACQVVNAPRCYVVFKALNGVDAIHAHFGENGARMINFINRYNIKVPLIVSFHGRDINVLPSKDRTYRKMIVEASRSDDVFFVAPSDFLRKKIVALGVPEKKVEKIYNACNPMFRKTSFTRSYEPDRALRMLSVGRYEEVKGYDYLLKACDLLRKNGYRIYLDIFGFGQLAEKLSRHIKGYGLEHIVSLKGKVPHDSIPDIMRDYDLYLQPSIITAQGEEENLGVATIEALTNGLPCIVSSIGGLVEVVQDGVSGLYVEEKSPEDIYEKVRTIIENSFLIKEFSAKARATAFDKFDYISLGDQWYSFYSETVA